MSKILLIFGGVEDAAFAVREECLGRSRMGKRPLNMRSLFV